MVAKPIGRIDRHKGGKYQAKGQSCTITGGLLGVIQKRRHKNAGRIF
jgi:hypothetical protein